MLPHTTHNHPQSGDIQQTRRFGRLVLNRSDSPEDYYSILTTLRKAKMETKVAVIEQCFPLWIKLITSFGETYKRRFFQIFDAEESGFIPQVGFLFMDAIFAVGPKRQKQLWRAIGPQLESFIEWWKEQAATT